MHVSYEERNDSFVRPNHASSSGETSASTTGTAVPASSRPNSLVDDVRREYHQMISSGDSRRMADSSSASEDEVHERSLDNSDPFQDGMATRMGSSAKVEFVAAPTVVQPPHLHRQPPSHIHVPSSLGITTPEPPGSSNHTLHNDEAKSGAEAADGDDDDGFGDFEEAAVAEHSFARGTTNSIGSLNPDPPFSLAGDGEVASLANTTRTITNASLFSNDSTTAVGAIRTWAGRQPLNVSARGSKQQQLPPHLQHSHLSQSNKNNNSTSASAEDAAGGDFFPLPAYAAPVAVTPLRRSNPDAPENKNFWSASPSLCGVEASESQWGTMMMMDGTNGRLGSPLSSRFGTAATNAKGSSSQDEGSSDLYSAQDGTVNLAMVAELNHCRSRRTSPQHPRSAAVDAARLRKCFGLLLREAATKPTAAALASPAHVAAEASSPTLSRVAQSSPHRTNLNHSQYTTHAPSVGATYFSSLLTSAKDEDSVTRVFEALAFTRTATATATTAAGAEAGATTAGRPHSTATRSPVHGGGGAASVVGNDSLWFAEAVPAENSFAGEGMWQGSPRCGAEGQLWSCQELTQQTGGPGAVDADADDDDDVVPTVAVSPAESSHSCSASAGDPSHAGLVHPEHRLLQYLEHEWQKRRSLRSIGALA